MVMSETAEGGAHRLMLPQQVFLRASNEGAREAAAAPTAAAEAFPLVMTPPNGTMLVTPHNAPSTTWRTNVCPKAPLCRNYVSGRRSRPSWEGTPASQRSSGAGLRTPLTGWPSPDASGNRPGRIRHRKSGLLSSRHMRASPSPTGAQAQTGSFLTPSARTMGMETLFGFGFTSPSPRDGGSETPSSNLVACTTPPPSTNCGVDRTPSPPPRPTRQMRRYGA